MRRNFKTKKTTNTGKIPSNKTYFGGIEYKSNLEAFTAKMLNIYKIPLGYEQYTFTVLPSFKYTTDSYAQLRKKTKEKDAKFGLQREKVEAITYTPDFGYIDEKTKEGWIMETKGFANDSFPLRFKLFKKFLMDNGYKLTLFIPRNRDQVMQSIEIIKSLNY